MLMWRAGCFQAADRARMTTGVRAGPSSARSVFQSRRVPSPVRRVRAGLSSARSAVRTTAAPGKRPFSWAKNRSLTVGALLEDRSLTVGALLADRFGGRYEVTGMPIQPGAKRRPAAKMSAV